MKIDKVSSQEVLYRGIADRPETWKAKENRPSSAAFKQTSSLSVDREGARPFEIIVQSLQGNVRAALKAVAWFSAYSCIERNMQLRPDPTEANPYHVLIDEDENTVGIGKKAAKFLASCCQFSLIEASSDIL